MCGKRLKIFSLSLGLFFLSCFLPSFSLCYAEVRLTDKEANQLMSEIQESKKELNQVKTELEESRKESQELKTELNDVKNTYSEQKIYYEEQLTEAKKKNKILKTALVATGTSTGILLIVTIILLI